MNSQAISTFVKDITGLGPVRAKALRDGKEERLSGAHAQIEGDKLRITDAAGGIVEVALTEIEQIIYSPEKQKYFVHLKNGLVEVRPDAG